MDPTSLDTISWLGAHHVRQQDYGGAITYFQAAAEVQPKEVGFWRGSVTWLGGHKKLLVWISGGALSGRRGCPAYPVEFVPARPGTITQLVPCRSSGRSWWRGACGGWGG